MKHHLFYSTRTIGSIIGIVGLTVMLFITACAGYPTGGSTTGTAVMTPSPTSISTVVMTPSPPCSASLTCAVKYCTECVMGHLDVATAQLLSQFQQEFIVFYTQVKDVSGNAGGTSNYRITASIPAGLLPNQQALTEVDINSKTDTSAVNNAVLSPGQAIIIAAVLNPTPSGNLYTFTGIQIRPSNLQSVMDCGNVVEFVMPVVAQNTTKITYWQVGDTRLSFDSGMFSIDVNKPIQVSTVFQANLPSIVFEVQNVG